MPSRRKLCLALPLWNVKFVCLFSGVDSSTLTLIHLLLINFLMNSIIRPCIPKFSSCSNDLFLLILSYAFSMLKKDQLFFYCYFWYCIYCAFFLRQKCLSSIFSSRYQDSLLFIILLCILQSILVRATGLLILTSFEFQKKIILTTKLQYQESIEEAYNCLTRNMLQTVENTIPKTCTGMKKRPTVIW